MTPCAAVYSRGRAAASVLHAGFCSKRGRRGRL